MPPVASLGLVTGLVNKWNPWLLQNKRITRLIGTAFAPRQAARRARPKTNQRRGFQWQIRIDLNASKNRSDEQASNATLIGDLWRSVEVLTVDIEREEMRAHLGSNGLATFALRVCFILSF